MNKFFSPDNFAMKALSMFCDWMYINILFIICSIPIFTIGASLTAMYSIVFKKLRKEDPPIAKTFFKEFKANFKKSTIFWIPFLLICAFLTYDVYLAHSVINPAFSFLQYPASIFLFIIVCATVLVLPQVAVFDSPLKAIIKNSVLLAVVNFPTIFLVIIIPVFIFLLAMLSGKATIIVISLFLFFGFGALAYFYCLFFKRIFIKTLMKNSDMDEDDIDI